MNSLLKTKELSQLKPPVVVVLGHVDHGKTSLLDYIRRTNIVGQETGQITQHIGAYDINFQGKKITFIDTPGHEAFSKMRSHGARLADIALLIIAANEGIKPQTKEVLKQIQDLKLPYIVVLNKIDLAPQYHLLQEIEHQLQRENIAIEAWGGDVPLIKTSTKNGEGINELLETILILGEMMISQSKEEERHSCWGVVIEARISSKQGTQALLLIKNGTLKLGDTIKSENQLVKVKKMTDWQGNDLKNAYISQPVYILGFNQTPLVGEIFEVISMHAKGFKNNILVKHEIFSERAIMSKVPAEEAIDVRLVIKTDVLGSQEAIIRVLETISQDSNINFLIIKQGLGDISEFDLKLAQSTKAVILGFRVKVSGNLKSLAERFGIKMIICDIIYEIKDKIKDIFEKKTVGVKEIKGQLEILAVFRKKELGDGKKKKNMLQMIIGGKVLEGELVKNCLVDIIRNKNIAGQGKILEIEKNKEPISKIVKGEEGGLLYEGNVEIKKGDTLSYYSK